MSMSSHLASCVSLICHILPCPKGKLRGGGMYGHVFIEEKGQSSVLTLASHTLLMTVWEALGSEV